MQQHPDDLRHGIETHANRLIALLSKSMKGWNRLSHNLSANRASLAAAHNLADLGVAEAFVAPAPLSAHAPSSRRASAVSSLQVSFFRSPPAPNKEQQELVGACLIFVGEHLHPCQYEPLISPCLLEQMGWFDNIMGNKKEEDFIPDTVRSTHKHNQN